MKKKICFVVSTPFTTMFLLNQLKAFSKDYELFLVANINDENKYILQHQNFDHHKSIPISRNINPIKDLKTVYSLFKYFRKMKFDAVHSITPKAGLVTALAAKFAKIENRFHIFTGQVWATKTGFFRFLLKTLDKLVARFATQILVDGKSQRDFLIKENVLKKGGAIVLGNGSISGVDLEKYKADKSVRDSVRNSLNLPDETVVYLFLGRLNIDKGIVELAKAFNKLSQQKDSVFLLIVGFDEAAIMERVDEIILDKSTYHFAGGTTTPEKYYQASDVFCLPSYREGFGMSVMEASACQVPVICSDAYGLLDTIVDNSTGLRHLVKDVESLYKKMDQLSDNKSLREELGKNGRKYVEDNFSSELLVKEWSRFYNQHV